MENRKLTDADIEAIAEAIREKMMEKFYNDLGRGMWAWVKRAAITVVFTLAAYGAARGYIDK